MKNLYKILFACALIATSYAVQAQACNGSFTYQISGDTVRILNTSTYTANANFASGFWTFGDGAVAQDYDSTMHVYAGPGTYTVCFYMTAYFNTTIVCRDTVCETITIPTPCNISAAWNYYNPSGGLIYFSSVDTNHNNSHYWNFGDGSANGSGTGVSHTYANSGTYRVCLYVYTPGTNCFDSVCSNVTVQLSTGCHASFTTSPATNSQLGLNFTNTSTVSGDTIQTYSWSFGDGTTSTSPNPSHQYANYGAYYVCLTITTRHGCTNTSCDSVHIVYSNPCDHVHITATWSATYTSGNVITFTTADTNHAANHYWNFGDGSAVVNAMTTTHTYTHSGYYRVCLYVYVPGVTCVDSMCNYVQVSSPTNCAANFTYFQASASSTGVAFTSTSVAGDSIVSYRWTFGDGGTSSLQNPGHGYANFGTYYVCLTITTVNGCTSTHCDSVHLTNNTSCATLTANWTFTVSGNTVHVNAADTNTVAHHFWNFGDGTTISAMDTSHHYANAGTYRVCFYDYIPGAPCVDSFCQNVTIANSCSGVTAAWQWYQHTGNDTVTFYSSTATYNMNHFWTFGDGTTSTQPFPVHYYSQPGTYTVCLIVELPGTHCADTLCRTITVTGQTHCGVAAFNYYIASGTSIHAYSTSTGTDTNTYYTWYIWSSNGTLVQTQAGHTNYIASQTLAPGVYNVCLYISQGTVFCDSACQSITITSSSGCTGLSAHWSQTYLSNNNVQFTATDTFTSHHHYWSFGDGSTSTAISPAHGYSVGGLYHVCLYVYIPGTNCVDSFCQNIQASASGCSANYSYQSYFPPYNSVQFTDLSTATNSIAGWYWTFGDGTTGSGANPAHTFPHSGKYYVCLTISDGHGCYSTHCDSVNVIYAPCSGITASWSSTNLASGGIQFNAADTSTAVHHVWNFGDGTYATTVDPTHSYAHAGTYRVCLYVYIPGTSCIDSSCNTIAVTANGCSAHFTYQNYYPPVNGVSFSNQSTSGDSIVSYLWNFGDNSTATFVHGNHVYPHSGMYYVCLTITTAHGCTSTYCDSVKVIYNICYGLSATWSYTYTSSGGVQFTGNNNISGSTNLWTFGDGSSSTQASPVHYYQQAGSYTVCHIVTIPGTTCADTSCQSIQGTGTSGGCHANYSYQGNGTSVTFTNLSTSTDSIIYYSWSFGDGGHSNLMDPTHQYTTAGTYYVCLYIYTQHGCSSNFCDSVHVGANVSPCHASFSYSFDTCQVVSFHNSSTGSFSRTYWNFGDGSPNDTAANPHHTFPVGTWTITLYIYNTATGCQDSHTETITVQPCGGAGNDTVCGVIFEDTNGNGVQDPGEHGIANATVYVGNFTTHTDSTGHYQAIVPAGTYSIYYCAPTGYAFTIPVNAYVSSNNCTVYQYIVLHAGVNCGFNFGIQLNSVTICGLVYYDANNNGAVDPGESGLPNIPVILTSGGNTYTVYTDQYGHYCAVVPSGTYTVSVPSSAYPSGTITPASITVTATTNGQTYNHNDFSVYAQPGSCNLKVTLTHNTDVTAGYPAWYQIQVCNIGSNTVSGNVNLFYDPNLSYNYASPAAASQNSSTHTASWVLNNLSPGSCQYYYISLTADSTLQFGQFIFTMANATTTGCNDIDLTDNVDTLHQNVAASWDPNNKTVLPQGEGPQGNIHPDQNLIYNINFQNTGNATAVNIVIHDTLSNNLDINTFKMIGASHPYTMQFSGRIAIWKFNSIMLPDSAVDEPGSHGFVSYSISPAQGLAQGTQILNTAGLFFDYNSGVTTNATVNTIDYTLSVNDIPAQGVTITLQPNPFSQFTTIKVDGNENGFELKVYDVVGKLVRSEQTQNNLFRIERGNLAQGMYMYEVTQKGKVIGKGKMIAQ